MYSIDTKENRPGSCKGSLNENGAALVIALMFLAILAMLGTTAAIMTTTDIQIGSNYRSSAVALQDANAGVEFALAKMEAGLEDGSFTLPTAVWDPNNPSDPDSFRDIGNDTNFDPPTGSGFTFTYEAPGVTLLSNDTYFLKTTANTSDGSAAEIEIRFVRGENDPAFDVGIISDANITINGSPNITGGLHANGNLSQSGGGGTIIGDVSAVGSASAGSCNPPNCNETSNADEIDVPLITAADFDEWRSEAANPPNIYEFGPYTYSETGEQDKIVFVEGNITVSGSALKNVTIIATGDITVSGSSSMNPDGSIGTAMIAGGDITFNGSSHTYGAFWCNGNFTQNGSSMLEGSIVAGGNVTRNGTFNFIYNGDLNNNNLPPGYDCTIVSWKDVRA